MNHDTPMKTPDYEHLARIHQDAASAAKRGDGGTAIIPWELVEDEVRTARTAGMKAAIEEYERLRMEQAPAHESPLMDSPWIGVDLDGTLAHYDEWRGIEHIGPPIEAMRLRVRQWLAEGQEVRILTARVGPQRHDVPHTIAEITGHIEEWCLTHLGQKLRVTSQKDYCMVEFWDDRCVQVVPNTGRSLVGELAEQKNQRLVVENQIFEVLRAIAKQKLSKELNEEQRDSADFEYGYDSCVEQAREVLSQFMEVKAADE